MMLPDWMQCTQLITSIFFEVKNFTPAMCGFQLGCVVCHRKTVWGREPQLFFSLVLYAVSCATSVSFAGAHVSTNSNLQNSPILFCDVSRNTAKMRFTWIHTLGNCCACSRIIFHSTLVTYTNNLYNYDLPTAVAIRPLAAQWKNMSFKNLAREVWRSPSKSNS